MKLKIKHKKYIIWGCGHKPVVSAPLNLRLTAQYWVHSAAHDNSFYVKMSAAFNGDHKQMYSDQ